MTYPDSWIAFDVTQAIEQQASVARDYFASRPANEYVELPNLLAWAADEGIILLALDLAAPGRLQRCFAGVPPEGSWEFDAESAQRVFEEARSADIEGDVDPPRHVELPSGSAWVSDSIELVNDGQDWDRSALYQLAFGRGALVHFCGPDRPDDDWVSIAQTFEFLAEQ